MRKREVNLFLFLVLIIILGINFISAVDCSIASNCGVTNCWGSGTICDGEKCVYANQPSGADCGCDSVCAGGHCVGWKCVECVYDSHCGGGEKCENNNCVNSCTPNCNWKECGSDGCGGSCGTCNSFTPYCVSDWCMECTSDYHCPTDEYIGTKTCSENLVKQTYRNYFCYKPSSGEYTCENLDTSKTVETCLSGETCLGGSCIIDCSITSNCGVENCWGSGTICDGEKCVYANQPIGAGCGCDSVCASGNCDTWGTWKCVEDGSLCSSEIKCGTSCGTDKICNGANDCITLSSTSLGSDCGCNQACESGKCVGWKCVEDEQNKTSFDCSPEIKCGTSCGTDKICNGANDCITLSSTPLGSDCGCNQACESGKCVGWKCVEDEEKKSCWDYSYLFCPVLNGADNGEECEIIKIDGDKKCVKKIEETNSLSINCSIVSNCGEKNCWGSGTICNGEECVTIDQPIGADCGCDSVCASGNCDNCSLEKPHLCTWKCLEKEKDKTCEDGTFYSQCSLNQPFYCDNGELIGDFNACGCPEGKIPTEDGKSCEDTLCIKVKGEGNPWTNLNIVFIGSDCNLEKDNPYNCTSEIFYGKNPSNYLNKFKSDVEKSSDYFLNFVPFNKYRDRITIWRVDNIEDLNCSYNNYGIDRLLVCNEEKIFDYVMSNCDFVDDIFVIVNNEMYGGSGGSIAVFSTNGQSNQIMMHEFGHIFAGLSDEYETNYPGYPEGDSELNSAMENEDSSLNCIFSRDYSNIDWWAKKDIESTKRWLHEDFDMPQCDLNKDLEGISDCVGCFEGARYHLEGYYRATPTSLMRGLNNPFGVWNEYIISKKLEEYN
jgi:hypothetical protein